MNQYLSAPEHDAVSNSRAQLDAPELPTAATNAPYEFAQMASALTTISQQVLDVSDSPEQAVRTILAQALALVHAPAGVIVVAPRGQAPEFIHCQGLSDAARTRELICAHWEDESRIYRDKGDRWYCALDSVTDTLPHVGAWARSEGVGAILSAPLWLSERLVGHLSLLHTAPHRWTDVEVQTARLLAGQAAIAVDRVLLARRLRERLGQAEVLNRVFQAASSVLDPADILQNVCAELKHALGAPLITAWLLQQDLLRRVAEARDADYAPSSDATLSLASLPALQWALRQNEATHWSDLQAEASELIGPFFTSAAGSALVVPLLVRDAVVGVLQVERPVQRGFPEDQVTLVELTVAAITPTLENGWLFEQVQEARAEAENAYADLRRLNLLKSQFIQNVSHEFRTPLAIVKGYVDLIADGIFGDPTDPGMVQALQAVHTHTDNLVRIVESITTLEEAEVGHLYLTPQVIQPVCRAALKANWQKALRRNIEIAADIPENLPLLRLDSEAMLRALNHILDNAVKFSHEGGQIRLAAFVREGMLWIAVGDDGIGIAQEELGHIFERFYQVNGVTTRRYGGIGLGLSLAQEIVVYHRGEIWADSAGEGLGTTITIRLPLIATREEPDAAPG